ncbi:MAG: cadherin repeat domain-containing protein [Planctomycetaceae bacterium]|nr:cadherin repeat domain-containing protein [Planctomycetaceae bacterium]
MQQREKILLIALLSVVVFWWARPVLLSRFLSPLEERRQDIEALNKSLEQKELEQEKILVASKQLKEDYAAALPADPYEAQRSYTAWLTDQLEQSGWQSFEVTPGTIARYADLGFTVQTRVEGVVNSAGMARFLERFDSAGMLHRLERTRIISRSIEPGDAYDVSLTVEALSLKSSTRKQFPDFKPEEQEPFWKLLARQSPFSLSPPEVILKPTLVVQPRIMIAPGQPVSAPVKTSGISPEQTVQIALSGTVPAGCEFDRSASLLKWAPAADIALGEYPVEVVATIQPGDQILKQTVVIEIRVPNKPPVLQSLPEQLAYPNRLWTGTLVASDPDQPPQPLRFQLEGNPPRSATVDSRSGQIRWTPEDSQVGSTVTLSVSVYDSGAPPLKASTNIVVKVERDAELTTQLVGCLQTDDLWTAWFRDREVENRTQLQTGQQLRAGAFRGTIEKIDVDHIILATDQGRSILRVGQMLTDRQQAP